MKGFRDRANATYAGYFREGAQVAPAGAPRFTYKRHLAVSAAFVREFLN